MIAVRVRSSSRIGIWDPGDPLSLNRYVYCGLDPVNFVDPTGFSRTGAVAGTMWWLCVADSPFLPVGDIVYGLIVAGTAVLEYGPVLMKMGELSGGVQGNSNNGGNSSNFDPNKTPKNIYKSIKDSPNYPEGFKAAQNGMKKLNVKNGELLEQLRKIESGEWKKVLKNGYDQFGNEVSVHYFESKSGLVFDVWTQSGWSSF